MTRDFQGALWGPRRTPSPAQCPTRPRTPRRTPAFRDRRPSASMGLGHKGPGCEQQAYVGGNTQTPPSGPHHCEDPPFFHP